MRTLRNCTLDFDFHTLFLRLLLRFSVLCPCRRLCLFDDFRVVVRMISDRVSGSRWVHAVTCCMSQGFDISDIRIDFRGRV